MARNQEKAQSMLYRFREAQQAELGLVKANEKRPYLASMVDDLKEAERWRGQILSEIGKKVAKIQDSGLNDYQVRDLNDEINKLMREKSHWENRIIELGGPNYKRGGKTLDAEGREVPGSRGYRYFGRAKFLPGVKELFEAAMAGDGTAPRTRYELSRNIDADYYGYRDEDDGELLAYEDKVARRFGKPTNENLTGSKQRRADRATGGAGALLDDLEDEMLSVSGSYNGIPAAVAVAAMDSVPSQKEVEEYLMERRRRELFERFLGPEASQAGSAAAKEAAAAEKEKDGEKEKEGEKEEATATGKDKDEGKAGESKEDEDTEMAEGGKETAKAKAPAKDTKESAGRKKTKK
ncbi:Isy1-domain-containing protein [Gonapodya prolifera JEL478]|uniref:Isy1-domain-containing protein n=1 Tax=Gonapodya prolifera (strain JEL478) TaxID=1344416 RepID=A0A139A956_GONPJ|nr:Isy1-domain-containing protein [Gonapodya prolifera JEL478]|eukprot:KXS12933.1 Isy1-domain-containing protein [Gonapodya prolifera JEL478]